MTFLIFILTCIVSLRLGYSWGYQNGQYYSQVEWDMAMNRATDKINDLQTQIRRLKQ